MKHRSLTYFALVCFVFCGNKLYSQTKFWEKTGGPINGYILKIIINSSNHLFAVTYLEGVYRSTDDGTHWADVNTGLTKADVYSLAINANGILFAGMLAGGGVYRSTDNGDHWTAVNTGLPNVSIYDLTINSNGHLFAATYQGVFRSTNNGDNWTNIGLMINKIRFIKTNASGTIFAGTSISDIETGIYRSTNSGVDWNPINNGLSFTGIQDLALLQNGDLYAMISADGKLFRFAENTTLWMLINTEKVAALCVSLIMNSSGHLFLGTTGNGVFRSTNNGSLWTDTELQGKVVPTLAINSVGKLFAGTADSGVFRSVQTTVNIKQSGAILPVVYNLKQN